MIKHDEVIEAVGILLCSLDMSDYPEIYEAYNTIKQYIIEQEKKDELLELKNREIKLLKARLFYNDNDECQDVLFFENSNALEDVREQIKDLEEEMK